MVKSQSAANALAQLFFSFSKGSVFGNVLEHRHPAADLKNSIPEETEK
jgi:hypothetical protein